MSAPPEGDPNTESGAGAQPPQPPGGTESAEPSNDGPRVVLTNALEQEIRDALRLLRFVAETGFRTADGTIVSRDVITGIKHVAAKFGIVDSDEQSQEKATLKDGPPYISVGEWIGFEVSYHLLAMLTAPVTAQTLIDTRLAGRAWGQSPAQLFSLWLWCWSILFAVLIIISEWWTQRYGPVLEGEVSWQNSLLQGITILIPLLYGGLGSCAYLLRKAHTYIYERTFDVRRKPEYANRILLGAVSGSAILLFVNQITNEKGDVVRLGSAALGFLAGYSTDFLFNTIERIIGAILPKVGISSVQEAVPRTQTQLEVTAGGFTLKELIERFEAAQGPDREMYRSLIEKLRDRL
jgi:hypothetical protein